MLCMENKSNAGRNSIYNEPMITVSFSLPRWMVSKLDAMVTGESNRSFVLRRLLNSSLATPATPTSGTALGTTEKTKQAPAPETAGGS